MSNPFQDKAEFERIFKEYYNPLCNFVNQNLRNWESSKEVVQATFMKIWESRNKLDIHTSVNSYLYTTTRNTMIDFIRKEKKGSDPYERSEDVFIADYHDDALNPYLLKEIIYKSLNKLKPKAQEIFKLNKFEGLTYKEISKYLNISERSVEDNIARAFKALKEDLKDHPELF